jgi:hypothetical protein
VIARLHLFQFVSMTSKKILFVGALLLIAALLLFPVLLKTLLVVSVITGVGIAVAIHSRGSSPVRLLLGFCAMVAFAVLAIWFDAGAAGAAILALGSAALSEAQIQEFQSIMDGLREYRDLLPQLKEVSRMDGGLRALPQTIKELADGYRDLKNENARLRKTMLAGGAGGNSVRWIGEVPFVSEDCARALTSIYVIRCAQASQWPSTMRDSATHQRVFGDACNILGIEQRAALTTTDIPVPTVYVPQIVELVWKYGQARQWATVFPLGAGQVKLPRNFPASKLAKMLLPISAQARPACPRLSEKRK